MPRGDGTGPAGAGPMTGRAAGYCAGYRAPGYMNPFAGRAPLTAYPPAVPMFGQSGWMAATGPYAAPAGMWGRGWRRPLGRTFGRGGGRGRGFGRGFGRGRWR